MLSRTTARRAVACGILVWACSWHVVAGEPKDVTATVACWNVLGFEGGRHRIRRERAKNIAKGIAFLDAEVIVLSELLSGAPLNTIKDELTRLGAAYTCRLPEDQESSLKLAIFYKNGVDVQDVDLIPDSDGGDPDVCRRKAVTAKVTLGRFDFILIGVHLKSGGGSRAYRTRQCAVIARHIRGATQGAEKDMLVVGDYNMVPPGHGTRDDSANFTAMSPGGSAGLKFISSGEMYGTGTHVSSSGVGNRLDGYAISERHTQEYIKGSLRVFPLNQAFGMTLGQYVHNVSDHLPLVARFRIAGDDD